MISALISLIFGLAAFLMPIPIIVPAIGAALGANGYLKENKKEQDEQKMSVKVISVIGLLICCLSVVIFFLSRSS